MSDQPAVTPELQIRVVRDEDALEAATRETNSRLFTIRYPSESAAYLIPQGSVAVDGISLTVARLEKDTFTVAIIPHTFEYTIASEWEEGRRVNLEFDMIGKYVARYMATRDAG